MKGSTVALVLLGVAGAGAAVYFLVLRQGAPLALNASTPAPARAAAPAAKPNALQSLEGVVGQKTGVPLTQLGAAAQKAPTWLKVAAFPVGVTAVAQSLINHPKQTVVNAAHTVVADTKKVGSAISSGAHSVVSAIGSIF